MATHPRDHVFAYTYQGPTTQTDVTLVTLKVRVNGGAATTYTNVSTPAVTQNSDCNFGYRLEIPANTYADGDKVERTWLYNSVAQAYGEDVIGFTSVDGSHYTNARGDALALVDASVSTRSTYAGADTSGTTTLLGRVDVSVSTRSTYAGADTAGTTTLLSRITSTRAGYLDNLTNLDAAISGIAASVWASGARTLTAISDSSGVTTLLSRLTGTRATNLDNLDSSISSRLPTAGYAAPDNAGIADIKAKTDALPSDPASESGVIAAIPSTSSIASAVWAYAVRTLSRNPRSEG